MNVSDLKNIDLSTITHSHTSAALLWLSSISRKDKWNLSEKQQCEILGHWDIELYKEKLASCLNGNSITLDDERTIRLSLLLKFHRLLSSISPENYDSSLLFNSLNSADFLEGASIREYLLKDSSLERYVDLKNYLETVTADQYS